MLATGLQLLLAPLLAGLSGAVALRWDDRRGGLVSAFPAIVGPLLLVAAHEHGRPFAARLAVGTLLGLVALSGFAVVYARAAQRWPWAVALALAWGAAVVIATAAGALAGGSWVVAAAAAIASLTVAARALPRVATSPAQTRRMSGVGDILVRMWLTAVLVVALAAAAGRFGALAGGILAALPVLASVLAVTTHRQQDACAVCALMAGMLTGMVSFVGFCVVIAALLVPVGAPLAFALATAVAVLAQVAALRSARPGTGWSSPGFRSAARR